MAAVDAATRCAVHPALPAADTCPVCERPRCAADATAAPGGGCLACEGRAKPAGPPPLDLRALVRAGAACGVVTVVAGMISSDYVFAGAVGYVVPLLVGIVVGMAAEAAAGKRRGRALRVMASMYAVLAVAVGLRHPQAAASPFTTEPRLPLVPIPVVVALYAIAAAGAWFWTAPPRRR